MYYLKLIWEILYTCFENKRRTCFCSSLKRRVPLVQITTANADSSPVPSLREAVLLTSLSGETNRLATVKPTFRSTRDVN